ncbi:hypothetical protein M3697_16505 [Janibacter melonis]|uniref:hypothetical protein n=1 Tax=Janibacter melonis TaxID=262209 RepID=UPI0020430CDB|nr:hypothetical protein [Janibacter melonis]MCM3556689.1 hypothetical protein [Janibacter melonis]
MTNLPAGRRSLEATEQQWQVVVEALIQVSTAWREVSPESQGPVNELLQDARSNVAYWRARSKGLDEREASCMLPQGPPTPRYIDYDGIREENASR